MKLRLKCFGKIGPLFLHILMKIIFITFYSLKLYFLNSRQYFATLHKINL